jgi:hypothetical protein
MLQTLLISSVKARNMTLHMESFETNVPLELELRLGFFGEIIGGRVVGLKSKVTTQNMQQQVMAAQALIAK